MAKLRLAVFIGLLWSCIFASATGFMPESSCVLSGYEDRDIVERRLKLLPLHDIEGIWQWVDNGSVIVIERYCPENVPHSEMYSYRMIVLRSPRLSVRPGTVMGYINATAKRNCYEAGIYTDFDGGTVLFNAKRFVLTLDGRRMSFAKRKSSVKVNLWRLAPYMFRYSITRRDDNMKGLDGCVKLYPDSSEEPLAPRYL